MKETISFWQSTIDDRYRETLSMIHPGKDIDQAIREAFGHLAADQQHLEATEPHQFKRLVNTWLGHQKPKAKEIKPVYKSPIQKEEITEPHAEPISDERREYWINEYKKSLGGFQKDIFFTGKSNRLKQSLDTLSKPETTKPE